MMEIGVSFIVIALLVAELFKTLIYTCDVTVWAQGGHKKLNISHDFFCIRIELKLPLLISSSMSYMVIVDMRMRSAAK